MTLQQGAAQDRTVAALVHLSIFLNFLVLLSGVIAALVVALLYRDRSAFVARHAFQSLAFQVGMGLVGALVVAFAAALWVGAFLAWMPWILASPGGPPGAPAPLPWIVGLFMWALVMGLMLLGAALLVLAIVLPIAGAVRAHRGEEFDYPVVGRLVPSWWYSSGR